MSREHIYANRKELGIKGRHPMKPANQPSRGWPELYTFIGSAAMINEDQTPDSDFGRRGIALK